MSRCERDSSCMFFFFFNDTATTEIYTLSLHDALPILTAIRHRTTLDGSHGVRRPNSEFYLRPPAEAAALFADCPDAVANTLVLAERCRGFDITRDLGYGFPDFRGADRSPAPQALAELCRARLHPARKPPVPGPVLERESRVGTRHRPRFSARDPRGADPPGLQALR